MRPDDRNGTKAPYERPLRVLIIAGSDRRQYNCPGVDSKARTFMMRMADRLPEHWEVDYEYLGNVYSRAIIRSCNACVSTSMALCCWPCNCYAPDDRHEPDLMWDLDLYARLDLADAWAIIGPVNWYAPSSNLKLMFDRLVCMNGGNPREDLIAHKDPELAMRLEHEPRWRDLSRNHLEGHTAAFFCYGDDGADEIGSDGRPKGLSRPDWFDPNHEPFAEPRDAYAPLVWQCRGAARSLARIRPRATQPSLAGCQARVARPPHAPGCTTGRIVAGAAAGTGSQSRRWLENPSIRGREAA